MHYYNYVTCILLHIFVNQLWMIAVHASFPIAILNTAYAKEDYSSVLVPYNRSLELVCACISLEIDACPSANHLWLPTLQTDSVYVTEGAYGKPTKITYKAVNWSDLLKNVNCTTSERDQIIGLQIALFDLTSQNVVANTLGKSYELKCVLRTNVASVLSAMEIVWYRAVNASASAGLDGNAAVDLNASSIVSDDWTLVNFHETISKDGALRYTRTDVNKTEPYLVSSTLTTHYLLFNTLRVERLSLADIGAYRCVYTYASAPSEVTTAPRAVSDWTRTAHATVTLSSVPFVNTSSQSTTVLEGDSFVVDCDVFGVPAARVVSWSLLDSTDGNRELFNANITASGDLSVTQSDVSQTSMTVQNFKTVENGRLRISSATYALRGYYECVAQNIHGRINSGTLVRVKSRYAFVYPLIGIVIELLVLALVIIICERRRSTKPKDKPKAKADNDADFHGGVSTSYRVDDRTNGGSSRRRPV